MRGRGKVGFFHIMSYLIKEIKNTCILNLNLLIIRLR